MAETIHVRGEGGAVLAMDLPLPESIAQRYAAGLLPRVNADGSPYAAAPPPAGAPASAGGSALTAGQVPRPGARAAKDEWVLWAAAVHGISTEAAEAMTKAALADLPDTPAPTAPQNGDSDLTAGRPPEDADKAEWIRFVVSQGLLSAGDAANYTRADLIDMVS